MDSNALKTFMLIAKLESFSEAAERLHLTQPAVSKRIIALEDELNIKLFDRLGRSIILTDAGRVLLRRAERILNEVEDSRREIANLSVKPSGTLNIGTSHHIGLYHLPKALQLYTLRYPGVELDLQFMNSELACKAVLANTLELAVITLPLNPHEDLLQRVVWKDTLCIVASHAHPLLKDKILTTQADDNRTCRLDVNELSRYHAILPTRGTYTRELVEEYFKKRNVIVKTKMDTNYLETIKMLVSVGLGWSVLPSSMLTADLVTLRIDDSALTRDLGLVWRRLRTLSNASKAMIDILTGL